MEPLLFLDVAKKFLNMPSEAAYRSAVSRAYYAVFHYDLKSDDFGAQFKSAIWIVKAEQAILTLNTLSASQNICIQIRNGIRAYEEKLKT